MVKTTFACYAFFVVISFLTAQTGKEQYLRVPEIQIAEGIDIGTAVEILEKLAPLEEIDKTNWEAFPYRPRVLFRIAHSDSQILLKFYVDESPVVAKRSETNSDTHRDSCVEFFLDPTGDGKYYNIEVNCVGTVHLAYGESIRQRNFLPEKLIKSKVTVIPSLGNVPFGIKEGNHHWELLLIISKKIFIHNPNLVWSGLKARGNFYKCADDSPSRHYLTWNPVRTEKPNFHQPSYFGTLYFE